MTNVNGFICDDNPWASILELMPPTRGRLAVAGSCASPKKAQPQRINTSIVTLDVEIVPPSGIVDQISRRTLEYVDSGSPKYDQMEIRPCDVTIPTEVATLPRVSCVA